MGHTEAMPVALQYVIPPHKCWTREECSVLESSGFVDLEHYELIEGELIPKMPKNPPHSRALKLLVRWLEDLFGRDFILPESSLDLRPEDNPTSQPEPDLMVLTAPFLDLAPGARPCPPELRLVAEVSCSTLAFDLTTKARLYSRSGIIEYWVLDVEGRRLLVHRDPAGDAYRSILTYGEHESVGTLAAPAIEVRVGDFLQ